LGALDEALSELYDIKNHKDTDLALMAFNMLFEKKLIAELVDAIVSDVKYSAIRGLLKKANSETLDVTVKDQAELSIWKFSKFSSDSIKSISDEILKLRRRQLIKKIEDGIKNLDENVKSKANEELNLLSKLMEQIEISRGDE
jgi:hypothetical protein